MPDSPLPRRRRIDFGGTGFLISFGIHVLLAIVALTWVITRYVTPEGERPEEIFFATGAGGGSEGQQARTYEPAMKPRQVRNFATSAQRWVVQGPASVALPEMPELAIDGFGALAENDAADGGASKGSGGGSGGGIGLGRGVGVGGGKNLVGKFIMGAHVKAQKIAVYLDCSASMTRFLPRVKEEIYTQFPDADIFEHPHIRIVAVDGTVYQGRGYKGRKLLDNAPLSSRTYTDRDRLSLQGKKVFQRYENNFEEGSVGAWMDIMQRERYDALVVFSDFQDGVRQYKDAEDGVQTIYADAERMAKPDGRSYSEKKWEREWTSVFKRQNAPKLYLFSIQVEPQALWQQLVGHSQGEIKMVPELREQEARGTPAPRRKSRELQR